MSRKTTTVRRIVALAMTSAGLADLSGCALSAGSSLSAESARDVLYGVLDSTQEQLGGMWENQDDPTPRGCVIPLWVDGDLYPALRIGDAPADVPDALATVTEQWTGLGYSVQSTEVGNATELKGTNSLRELLLFRVSAEAMTLQGESECRPAA